MGLDASELRKFGNDLTKMGADANRGGRLVVEKTAADISGDAKKIAFDKGVIDTGNLINSIGYDVNHRPGESSAEIGPTVEYAGYNEWGTSRMPPRPFLGPAFDRRIPGFEKALGNIVDGTWKG